jgi:quercetin dioxygenase-like cupin family protein
MRYSTIANMLSHSTFLFLGGVDVSSLFIVFVVLSLGGFFLWRALLKFLVKKGDPGINIAAAIVGAIQSPILVLMIGGIIYWVLVSREAMEQRALERSAAQEQPGMGKYEARDTSEIDVIKVSPDKCKVLMENEYVRVLEYTLAPGQKDNPHTHPPKSYYVVEGGTLRVYPEKGQPFDAEERKGAVEWGDYIGKHHVENVGSTTVKLLLTEVKAARY